jgi:kynureninase
MPVDWSATRSQFHIPHNTTYLDGNSLGLLSRDAEHEVLRTLDEWKTQGVQAWHSRWLSLQSELAALLAPLLGALPDEVALCNQTTVNLHQLLGTFFSPTATRNKILIDDLAFPSDSYAVQSHLALRGLDPAKHLVRVRARDDGLLHEQDLVAAMTDDVALVLLPAVVYTTGQLLDLPTLARVAHARGILIGFDLAHSAGAVPHALHHPDPNASADFAFGCTYKYLSSGPGATAFLFVHLRHLHKPPALAGWFGADPNAQFEMPPTFPPASTAARFAIGTPPLLSTAPLVATLKLYNQLGINAIRARSLELTAHLIQQATHRLLPKGIQIATPTNPAQRGGHISLRHPNAKQLCAQLIHRNIIPDYRNPNLIRLAPVALYNNEADVDHAVRVLSDLL